MQVILEFTEKAQPLIYAILFGEYCRRNVQNCTVHSREEAKKRLYKKYDG